MDSQRLVEYVKTTSAALEAAANELGEARAAVDARNKAAEAVQSGIPAVVEFLADQNIIPNTPAEKAAGISLLGDHGKTLEYVRRLGAKVAELSAARIPSIGNGVPPKTDSQQSERDQLWDSQYGRRR